ncbi:uncharacterized protein Bfra_006048 [Botrytis fragariae]|uniref:Uncharacterized protein n=1 Tax=Botrytis fragariae TaxID=1964551 RepID=A0A8H6EI28_9HELO|nr:uncharacterized protein Bfra_006048 [Botrytis fragariae]KAF5872685.1 hypothetical protein Bfra_006048 [Botrytis fragariae]
MASSSRSSNRRAERQQDVPEPVKGFAFTVRGLAVEDGFKDRGVKTTICASAEKKNQFQDLKTRAENGEEGILRMEAEFTRRELGPLEPGLSSYLVVGYVLLEEDHNRTFDQSETSKKKPVGATQPERYRKFDDNPMPILVVTDVIDAVDDNYQMRYYALMSPKNGICTPNKVKIDNIYFVHEFRDLETALKTRKTTWGRLALAAAVRPDILATPTVRQADFKRSKPTSKSIRARCGCGLSTPPPPSCTALRNFCELDRDLSIEEAKDVVAEVQSLWPEVGEIRWEAVRQIKRGLVDLEAELEYRLVRAVLAEGGHVFRYQEDIEERPSKDNDETMNEGGDEVNDTVMCGESDSPEAIQHTNQVEAIVLTAQRMIPLPESTMSILTKGDRTILAGVLKKLKEIQKAMIDGDQTILDACGDTSLEEYSIHEIWGKFADSVDTDTSKMAFMAVVKRLMIYLVDSNRGVRDMLEELISLLDRLLRA